MPEKSLHIIILNWNGEKVIGECLDSLKKLSYSNYKITVVDNASEDSSPEMVRERFPEVELIENEENLLFAGGNNIGLRKALDGDGELFLLLNNDTEVHPDFASEMAAVLEREDAGVAGPRIYYYDDPERIWYGGGRFYPVIGVPRHHQIRKLDTGETRPRETGYVTGCAMMVRREVFREIGLLDMSYRMYCEDVDFSLRARGAGWKCWYVPASRVWHKVSSSSGGGFTPYKLKNRMVSTARLFKRHKPLWWRIALAPVHALLLVIVLIGLIFTGKWELFRAAARGMTRALKVGYFMTR
ncbi:MAG: glycosyltransferase [Candidatus Latescibacteria bacterium]|nr:glycosyltransferase [bacterium]MBD3425490.1 glycosyltransferase [Candidatus Latescibacterota bacterium]